MQTVLITLNASPYGDERALSALRLTLTLAQQAKRCRVQLFLLSDAVVVALKNQKTAQAPTLGEMLTEALTLGVEARVCRTCADARGIHEDLLLAGVKIGTMPELAEWTLSADKALSF
ncbi:DsrE family protein [Chromobacterium alkanivorans]|uniref:DsrE/DsrF/TusD sulfur relay family protein n=1 Tax=Chromobacterium alkanivorans TaxID=1071719 RepID=UPI00196717B8|nr:DsrE family protein [Chromobacterium alkanivorans]MBN3006786.1 DsrE family protein [Chromobacterium alkanivorans]